MYVNLEQVRDNEQEDPASHSVINSALFSIIVLHSVGLGLHILLAVIIKIFVINHFFRDQQF